ncbi:MAG: hypothetical protein AAF848_03735 [Pseudomonadota bacterium]
MRIAIGLVFVVLLGAALYQLSPLKTAAQDMQAQQPQRHPASHVIRITAKLSFDGVPVVIDDLIDCTMPPTVPEGASNIRFGMSRERIATEISGGGMIYFQASRKLCFAFGDVWGKSVAPVYTDPDYVFDVPKGWTPRLDWYNHRDPREATDGLIYVSETAIWAENGRLRVVEPFKVEIPDYPASPDLIAEARAQVTERELFPGGEQRGDLTRFLHRKLPIMIRIPEDLWRNPERVPGWQRVVASEPGKVDHEGLVKLLESHMDETALVDLGVLHKSASEEISRAVGVLLLKRRFALAQIGMLGVPRTNADRRGMLTPKVVYDRSRDDPYRPNRMDEYIPWHVDDDGVVRADFDNPGLIHWKRDQWFKPENFVGMDLLGKPFTYGDYGLDRSIPYSFFDPSNNDLWFTYAT